MLEENPNITSDSNSFIITNKSSIEKKPILTEEAQDEKDLQFLYQITSQNFPSSNFKKDLNSFLEIGKIISFNMPSISSLGEVKKNSSSESLLYKNKLISFNSNLNLFHNRMNFIRENNKKFNDILTFIKMQMYKNDFYLDKDFEIKENDAIIDLDKIILHHRFIKNFEDLINIKNKNFKIKYEENQYKITSDFYEYFSSKYILLFSLNIKSNNFKMDFSNGYFEQRIKAGIESDIIVFYLKYLLYKFMKEEINALRKYFSNTKATCFEYKGLTFTWKKIPKALNIKCNYFDNLEISFSISKYNKEYKEPNFINSREDSQIKEYFRMFCRNIFSDVKYSKNIINFIGNVKRSQNLTFENIIKSSIFVKNLSKLGLLILKAELNKVIDKESNALNIINAEFFNTSYYFAKYELYFEFIKGNKMNYLLTLYFDKDLNLTVNVKEPYLNHIYVLDNTNRYSIEKGRINFNSLFKILKSIVPLLENYNHKKISIKIISI